MTSRTQQFRFVGSAASPEQFPRDGLPEVAVLGRSNVGKSSLVNALTGTKGLAKVSSTPGRTRLVNFFRMEDYYYLTDLPGYGFARVPDSERQGWERLVTSYLLDREPLKLCIFLVDVRHEPQPGDETLGAFLDHHALPYAMVATKADKLGRGEVKRRLASLTGGLGRHAVEVLAVSSTTGEGLGELRKVIRSATVRGAGGKTA